MNKLGRDIKIGEILVDEDGGLWKATGGFGLSHKANGSVLYALPVGKDGSVKGENCHNIRNIISKQKTEQYQKEHAKTTTKQLRELAETRRNMAKLPEVE